MTHNRFKLSAVWLLAFITVSLTACKDNTKKQDETGQTQNSAKTAQANTAAATLEPGNTYYYGLKTKAANSEEPRYNFELMTLSLEENGRARGMRVSAPYGVDGMAGSLKGIYNAGDNQLKAQLDYLAEGERYQQQRDFTPGASGIMEKGSNDVLPEVTKAQFDNLVKAHKQQMLANTVNTTDRSRLKKIDKLKEMFDAAALETVKFYEVYTDLDHDPATAEYLLYVMDPMYCGSGGCDLLVIDDKGKLLQNMSVTKLPIYTTRTSIEEERQHKGQWRDLYVWSQEMRRLVADEGDYPSNPSLQPAVSLEELESRPGQYRLLLDYLEQ